MSRASASARAFQLNRERRFLWLGERHRESLEALYAGVRCGASLVVLTGGVGSGKTMLIDAVAARIAETHATVGWLAYPTRDPDDFWNAIAGAFGLRRDASGHEGLRERFVELLQHAALDSSRVVLIIDEAQGLTDEVLAEVTHACDAAARANGSSALTVVLVGEDQLDLTLAKPQSAALARRIAVWRRLPPLRDREVASYIRHRLACAEASPDLFTPDALTAIARLSRGVPRLINIVCARASASGGVVDATIVERCGRELPWLADHGPQRASAHATALDSVVRTGRSRRRSIVVAMLAGAGLLALASAIENDARAPSVAHVRSRVEPVRWAPVAAPAPATRDVEDPATADQPAITRDEDSRPSFTETKEQRTRKPAELRTPPTLSAPPPAAAPRVDDAPGYPDPSAIIDWLLKERSQPTPTSR